MPGQPGARRRGTAGSAPSSRGSTAYRRPGPTSSRCSAAAPSSWSGLGRWDVGAGVYEPGAWLAGTIYPQRCDLSPDGRFFAYFALQPSARWELGWTYVAISRLPWLTALAAWGTAGTWTRGLHFVPDPSERGVDAPDHGMLRYDLLCAGLAVTRPATYAVERRRGWAEAEGSPPRDEGDVWDERRARELRMVKPRPGDAGVRLEVTGGYAAFRSRGYSREVAYTIESPAGRLALPRVQWADWSHAGDLLVATVAGELQVRTAADWLGAAATVADLREESPAPAPAPAQLRDWPRA